MYAWQEPVCSMILLQKQRYFRRSRPRKIASRPEGFCKQSSDIFQTWRILFKNLDVC